MVLFRVYAKLKHTIDKMFDLCFEKVNDVAVRTHWVIGKASCHYIASVLDRIVKIWQEIDGCVRSEAPWTQIGCTLVSISHSRAHASCLHISHSNVDL